VKCNGELAVTIPGDTRSVAFTTYKEIDMRTAAILMLGVIGLAGCEPIATDDTPVPSSATPGTSGATNDATSSTIDSTIPPADTTTPSSVTPPDNTAINERDADGATKTPIDQDETQADVNTTAKIRQQILDQDNLSINARNAKVITQDGKVTLRGPVENQAERDTLDRIAREVAGDANVDNQLEVANPYRLSRPRSNSPFTNPR
jgi:hypothetical protein